jgi:hypothetical protein
MALFIQFENATVAALAIQNAELRLPFWLVDRDGNQNAVLGDVLFEFEKFGYIKEVAGIVRARLDFLWK